MFRSTGELDAAARLLSWTQEDRNLEALLPRFPPLEEQMVANYRHISIELKIPTSPANRRRKLMETPDNRSHRLNRAFA